MQISNVHANLYAYIFVYCSSIAKWLLKLFEKSLKNNFIKTPAEHRLIPRKPPTLTSCYSETVILRKVFKPWKCIWIIEWKNFRGKKIVFTFRMAWTLKWNEIIIEIDFTSKFDADSVTVDSHLYIVSLLVKSVLLKMSF